MIAILLGLAHDDSDRLSVKESYSIMPFNEESEKNNQSVKTD